MTIDNKAVLKFYHYFIIILGLFFVGFRAMRIFSSPLPIALTPPEKWANQFKAWETAVNSFAKEKVGFVRYFPISWNRQDGALNSCK